MPTLTPSPATARRCARTGRPARNPVAADGHCTHWSHRADNGCAIDYCCHCDARWAPALHGTPPATCTEGAGR